jgi:tRNA(Ile)-lysidine synthase
MQLTDPVTGTDFAHAMAAVGPFESNPHLAVGLSGGADSMALVLLLADWVQARGGRLLTLTVDHGLRRESAAEAAQVATWMAERGIAHRILPWQGCKPASGIQAGARAARLRLLADAAAGRGILHLALAHHADDQAETAHLRRERGSGGDGLAGMPLVREMGAVRLIRPLLPFPKARLHATCRVAGLDWVDDPSNRDPRYARAALRLRGHDVMADLAEAQRAGEQRAMLDTRLALIAARHVRFHPEGWAILSADIVRAAGSDGPRLLTCLLRAVAGAAYPPPPAAVTALWHRIAADPGTGATLAGCRLLAKGGGWQLMREERNLQGPVMVPPGGGNVCWDGRFWLQIQCAEGGQVEALGDGLWRQALLRAPALGRTSLPAAVRRTCPAFTQNGEICAIPHLGFQMAGQAALSCHILPNAAVPAFGPRFAVVSAANDII